MTAAKCAGTTPAEGLSMAAMFDADDRETHRVARKICAGCPMVRACLERAVTLARESAASRDHAGPDGTWGGLLWRNGRVVQTADWRDSLEFVLREDVDSLRGLVRGAA